MKIQQAHLQRGVNLQLTGRAKYNLEVFVDDEKEKKSIKKQV